MHAHERSEPDGTTKRGQHPWTSIPDLITDHKKKQKMIKSISQDMLAVNKVVTEVFQNRH